MRAWTACPVVQRAQPDAFLTIGRVAVKIKDARPLARDVTLAAWRSTASTCARGAIARGASIWRGSPNRRPPHRPACRRRARHRRPRDRPVGTSAEDHDRAAGPEGAAALTDDTVSPAAKLALLTRGDAGAPDVGRAAGARRARYVARAAAPARSP